MKLIRTLVKLLVELIVVGFFMILPFLLLGLVEYLTKDISGETIVQATIVGSIITSIVLYKKSLKGGE